MTQRYLGCRFRIFVFIGFEQYDEVTNKSYNGLFNIAFTFLR